jgi:hypothetical protein
MIMLLYVCVRDCSGKPTVKGGIASPDNYRDVAESPVRRERQNTFNH